MPTRTEYVKDADIIFTGCSVTQAAPGQPAAGGQRRQVVVGGRRVKTIDVHCHCVIPETLAMMGLKLEEQRGPGIGEVGMRRIREAPAGRGGCCRSRASMATPATPPTSRARGA